MDAKTNGEVRLWDSQWVNIVNAPAVLNAETQEEAVSIAVRMTEEAIARNYLDCSFPPQRKKAALPQETQS